MEATTINTEECGACGKQFATLDEVFSHECSGLPERVTHYHPTRSSDNVDAPEQVQGRDGKSWNRLDKGNRYAGTCVKCGGQVPEQAGHLVKDNSKQRGGTVWGVVHEPGECQALGEQTDDTTDRGPAMSEKQESYLRSLLARKQPRADADGVVRTLNGEDNPRRMASAMIDVLKNEPDAPKLKVDQPRLTKGDVHVVDGYYYRVHVAQNSDRLYACKWDGSRFGYDKGAISKLSPDNKITAEQAAEFGHMHQRCVFCSLAIDTPESTEVGYGPICATKHGLPWG